MSINEHPTQQPISTASIVEFEDTNEYYRVGQGGVTKIEPFTKSGLHADIPYIRVWKGDFVHAEFCQHNIIGVYFEASPPHDHPTIRT